MLRKIIYNIFSYLIEYSIFNKIFSIIKSIDKFKSIQINDETRIFFLDLNWITKFRIDTFHSKEPETIDWIKSFGPGVFWDIGANVGLYSIYASLYVPNLKVVAFEPSVFNLDILVKNINKNKLNENIQIITNPLSKNNIIDNFFFSTFEKGGANSSFGKKIDNKLYYKTNSINCEILKNIYKIKEPNFVKIDVDGNELEILKSIFRVYPNVNSFLIEVNDNKDEIYSLMEKYDYKLIFEKKNRSNKIWIKKP